MFIEQQSLRFTNSVSSFKLPSDEEVIEFCTQAGAFIGRNLAVFVVNFLIPLVCFVALHSYKFISSRTAAKIVVNSVSKSLVEELAEIGDPEEIESNVAEEIEDSLDIDYNNPEAVQAYVDSLCNGSKTTPEIQKELERLLKMAEEFEQRLKTEDFFVYEQDSYENFEAIAIDDRYINLNIEAPYTHSYIKSVLGMQPHEGVIYLSDLEIIYATSEDHSEEFMRIYTGLKMNFFTDTESEEFRIYEEQEDDFINFLHKGVAFPYIELFGSLMCGDSLQTIQFKIQQLKNIMADPEGHPGELYAIAHALGSRC